MARTRTIHQQVIPLRKRQHRRSPLCSLLTRRLLREPLRQIQLVRCLIPEPRARPPLHLLNRVLRRMASLAAVYSQIRVAHLKLLPEQTSRRLLRRLQVLRSLQVPVRLQTKAHPSLGRNLQRALPPQEDYSVPSPELHKAVARRLLDNNPISLPSRPQPSHLPIHSEAGEPVPQQLCQPTLLRCLVRVTLHLHQLAPLTLLALPSRRQRSPVGSFQAAITLQVPPLHLNRLLSRLLCLIWESQPPVLRLRNSLNLHPISSAVLPLHRHQELHRLQQPLLLLLLRAPLRPTLRPRLQAPCLGHQKPPLRQGTRQHNLLQALMHWGLQLPVLLRLWRA